MEPQLSHAKELRHAEGKSKRAKPDRRWTLLFIGDHGRVLTLRRVKGFVFLSVFIFVLAAAAIVLLYWHNQNTNKKNEKLHGNLDILQKRIKALRHEKDILMARLVLAESRMKESLEQRTENQSEKSLQAGSQKEASQDRTTAKAEVKEKILVVNKPSKPKVEPKPSISNLSVDVEDFNIISLDDTRKIKIQFKVKNTSPDSQRVAGHTIVVLKGGTLKPKKWQAIPPMALVNGKPTGRQPGHGFAINYFRTMRFTTNIPPSADQFKTATVYVFTRTGEMLLEKNFPVEIPAQNAEASGQSSMVSGRPSMNDVLRTFKGSAAQQTPSHSATEDESSETSDPHPF